jgi:tripartite-type tricarboxylate transporter receptor subunit TctC
MKQMKFKQRVILAMFFFIWPFLMNPAYAQSTGTGYPNRPVRLIVGNAAGGLVDTVARILAQHLSERLGQPVIVDNRPGASEILAADGVAKSAPDGYTIFMASQIPIVLGALLNKSLPYNPQRDFSSISMVAESTFYLVVNPAVPAKTVGELILLAKSQPGKLTFASTGNSTLQFLMGELFKSRAKVNILHIPYKSSGPAVLDLVSGRVDMMFQGGGGTIASIRSGKLRSLAVTSAKRHDELPNLPTMMEAGIPDFDVSTWFALFGPADLPKPIIDRLNRETGEFLRNPEMRKKFLALGITLSPSTPEGLDERVRQEFPFWTKVVRDARIEPE